MDSGLDSFVEHKSVRLELPLGVDVIPEIERLVLAQSELGWLPVGVINSNRSMGCYVVFERLSAEGALSEASVPRAFRSYSEIGTITPLEPALELPEV